MEMRVERSRCCDSVCVRDRDRHNETETDSMRQTDTMRQTDRALPGFITDKNQSRDTQSTRTGTNTTD